jgi:hypothetical protein
MGGNIKTALTQKYGADSLWTHLADSRNDPVADSDKHSNEPLTSIKIEEFNV